MQKLRSHQTFRSEDTFIIFTNTVSKMTKSKFRSLTHALKDQCLNKKINLVCFLSVFSIFCFWFFFLWRCFGCFAIKCCNHVYYSIMAGVLNVRYMMYNLGNILVTCTIDRLNDLRKNAYQKIRLLVTANFNQW